MAGPSIGTWVKVRNKSGRTTARVIAKKFGGGSYSQGEVITQSEYNSYKDKRAEGMKAEASGGGGGGRQARQNRINEIRDNIGTEAGKKIDSIRADMKKKGQRDNTKLYDRLGRTKAGKKASALAGRERRQAQANEAAMATGSGNRANRRLARMRGEDVPQYRSFEQARQGVQRQQKLAGRRLQKAALSKQEKTSILLKNKKRIKAEASKSLDNYGQINRINRLEKADRARRKAENPNAPGFQRARKAADTRRKNASGGGQQKPAGRRLQKAALSKQQKADIMDRNLIQMMERDAKNRDESRIKANRLNRKKREVRRKYNSQTSAFKRARTAADTRRANARRKEEARR